MRLVSFVAVSLLLAGCVHAPKSPSDVVVGKEYQMLGAPAKYQECKLQVKNIATVVPSPMGAIELEKLGEPAIVCGVLDCREALKDEEALAFECVTLRELQSSSSK